MKSKEAIHIVKGTWGLIEELSIRYRLNATRREETKKEGEGIVELLEEGKAYRLMCEEVFPKIGTFCERHLLEFIEELEQKYFPKEEKNETMG